MNKPTSTGSVRGVQIRVHGGRENDRLIPLGPGKITIGSGPRCGVRIQEPGVQPLHFLIASTTDGFRVRRWAPGALLNGAAFDEAPLETGDRLTMGSVELEVVGPGAKKTVVLADPANALEIPSVKTPWPGAESIELESPADVFRENLQLEHDAREVAEHTPPHAVSKRQKRKLLAALRRHRDQYERLVGRVETLERQFFALRSGPAFAPAYDPIQPVEPVWQDDDATIVEGLNDNASTGDGKGTSADDWLISARAALSRDRSPWLEASLPPAEEPIEPTELDNFDEEVTALRSQLAVSETRIAEAQARLATLEHELTDSRRMLQHFAEERLVWQTQISDTEVRLAEYVDRIQELAGHLEEARGYVGDPAVADETATAMAAPVAPSGLPSSASWDAGTDTALALQGETVEAIATEVAPEEEHAASVWTVEEDEPSDESAGDESLVAAELAPQAIDASEEVSEPEATQDEAGPVPADVDHALAHLRELSIWRQSPVEKIETDVAKPAPSEFGTEATVDEEQPETDAINDPAAGPKATESFIDRFAHLLPMDDDAAGVANGTPEHASHNVGHATGGTATGASPQVQHGTAHVPAAGDDEESIEQYMAKMMERLRGNLGEPASSATETAAATAAESTAAPTVDEAADEAPTEEPTPRPRAQAAELLTDMDSLRALANQSARHAIGVHTARTLRRRATSRCISAVVAAIAASFFLFMSKSWDSLEFVTACIAAIGAIYWGQATCIAVVKAARAGAFDGHDEDFTAIDGSKLPPSDGATN